MSKPLIVVATPCYGGLVTQTYMTSVLKLTRHAARGDLDLDVMLLGGDALISRARSLLVAYMLDNPRATHLLFIDADIAFEVEQVLRLLRFDKDFVAGFYPVKQIDWQQVPRRALEGEPLTSAGLTYVGTLCDGEALRFEDGFATAIYAGTGFQLIRRGVFERMMTAYPELRFRKAHELFNRVAPSDRLFALFDCLIEPETGVYLSEDYAFCRRWRAIGGEIWLDTRSRLTHSGPQSFVGDTALRFRSIGTDTSRVAEGQPRSGEAVHGEETGR